LPPKMEPKGAGDTGTTSSPPVLPGVVTPPGKPLNPPKPPLLGVAAGGPNRPPLLGVAAEPPIENVGVDAPAPKIAPLLGVAAGAPNTLPELLGVDVGTPPNRPLLGVDAGAPPNRSPFGVDAGAPPNALPALLGVAAGVGVANTGVPACIPNILPELAGIPPPKVTPELAGGPPPKLIGAALAAGAPYIAVPPDVLGAATGLEEKAPCTVLEALLTICLDGVIAARTAFNPPREGDGGGPAAVAFSGKAVGGGLLGLRGVGAGGGGIEAASPGSTPAGSSRASPACDPSTCIPAPTARPMVARTGKAEREDFLGGGAALLFMGRIPTAPRPARRGGVGDGEGAPN